jgi:geranylgeranyl diphosphate synthase type II
MDKALVRRGRPTVHVKWNENTAILSGDQMMIESYKLLAQLPDNYLPTVLRMFNKMGTEICEGQQYDVDFESQQDVTISEYLKMIEYKTSVLLATALQIGGYLAGATQAQQDALYAFGIHVGLAFQVQDDYLDVYGDPVSFGKAIGGDICCNKKTFMLLNAMDRADASIREQLYQLLQLSVDTPQQRAHKIMQVTAIYDSLDVKQVAQAFILEQTDKACECLNQLPQNQHTHSLRELAHRLVNRNQ